MQKLSKTKFDLFMKSFQGVPSWVACSKLGTFTVNNNILVSCCFSVLLNEATENISENNVIEFEEKPFEDDI